ncbi:hypothetical protein BKA83DRAFT_4302703 [Pisolithus microcarpus]|nr:hypothetical protein BKA83DRAFT_4302703 [Pisolithus microcarpus]
MPCFPSQSRPTTSKSFPVLYSRSNFSALFSLSLFSLASQIFWPLTSRVLASFFLGIDSTTTQSTEGNVYPKRVSCLSCPWLSLSPFRGLPTVVLFPPGRSPFHSTQVTYFSFYLIIFIHTCIFFLSFC